MKEYADGFVDVDGLTWSEERGCWLSPADVAKRDAVTIKAAAKVERERKRIARAATKALERTWILVNVGRYADRGDLTNAYQAHFGKTRQRVATLHKEINDVLTADGIRLRREYEKNPYRRNPDGIATVPNTLKAQNEEEVGA